MREIGFWGSARRYQDCRSFGLREGSSLQEPWLLDRQTMKYDEMLPTLVLDLDKAGNTAQAWTSRKRKASR